MSLLRSSRNMLRSVLPIFGSSGAVVPTLFPYRCNVQKSLGSVPGLKCRASLYGQFDVARRPVTGQTITVIVPRSLLDDERRTEFELLP